jgi:hypothetical protein
MYSGFSPSIERELMSLQTVKPTISPCALATTASSGSGTS